jgi:hypothetical protein
MVGVIPGFTLVERKPWLSLVIDENLTLFSTYLLSTSEIRTVVGNLIQFYASPGHLKSGQKCPYFEWSRLDRFIIKKIIFMTLFFIKRSRLVDHLKSGHNLSRIQMVKKQDGCHNLVAILFYLLKSGQKSQDFKSRG